MNVDVAIVGGGPGGATAASLLRKYSPKLQVAIFEREVFPRDHIGESQLPAISNILHEMGAWDKVEAANFPIKLGSTNRWGRNPELWDFEFYPSENFVDEARPGTFQGQRRMTAFQVDRSIYDKILLDHAEELGTLVRQGVVVKEVLRQEDSVTGLVLSSGETVTAKHYIDASGHVGIIRRAMGVQCDYPSGLQNVAFWDYWQNAEWAVNIGVGGTKILVMSLPYGWIWFIPLGPTRTSIGLVMPAEHYKKTGKRPEELYLAALGEEERIAGLTQRATRENKFTTTKDWSFIAERQWGANWFLVGESAGFADPILSAGMTMAHSAGREVAYTIGELERGEHDALWLREQFGRRQARRIQSHIRFADFWYTANAQFIDLQEFIQGIARDNELELTPLKAWEWLARGGFIDEDLGVGFGGFNLGAIKQLGDVLAEVKPDALWSKFNVYRVNLTGATQRERALYWNGRIMRGNCYVRGDRLLPVDGSYSQVLYTLQRTSDLAQIIEMSRASFTQQLQKPEVEKACARFMETLEAMVSDGWVETSLDPNRPLFNAESKGRCVRLHSETKR